MPEIHQSGKDARLALTWLGWADISLLRQQHSIKKIGKLSHFHAASIHSSDWWPPVVNGGPRSMHPPRRSGDSPSTWRLQKSEVAPPPPESPPPKRTSGLPVWGLNVIECGDTRPNAVAPAFIQSLSFPERRCAVNPWRIPPGPSDTAQRRPLIHNSTCAVIYSRWFMLFGGCVSILTMAMCSATFAAESTAPLGTYTPLERRHWAFRPRAHPEIPKFSEAVGSTLLQGKTGAVRLRFLQRNSPKTHLFPEDYIAPREIFGF